MLRVVAGPPVGAVPKVADGPHDAAAQRNYAAYLAPGSPGVTVQRVAVAVLHGGDV